MPPPGGRNFFDAKMRAYEASRDGKPKMHVGLLIRMILYYNGDMKFLMLGFLGLFILQTVSFQLLHYSLRFLIDDLIPLHDIHYLLLFALTWALFFALHAVTAINAANCKARMLSSFIAKLRGEIIKKLQVLSMKFFDHEGTGSISAKILMDMDRMRAFFDWVLSALLNSIVSIIFVIPLLYSIDPLLSLVTVLYVPLIPIVQQFFMKKLLKNAYELRSSSARLSAKLVDFISGIKHIRIFASESHHSGQIISEVEKVRDMDVKFSMSIRTLGMAIQFLSDFMPVLIWVIGGIMIAKHHSIQMGALVAYVALVRMFYGNIQQLFSSFEQIISASPSVAAINEVLGNDDVEHSSGRCRCFIIDGSIVMEHVSFSYPSRADTLQLNDVSVSIRNGERVALVGESGSGKSTFVNALMGLYPAKSGSILFGGLDISKLHLPKLRSQMALMTQETFLFNTTLLENIQFANTEASFEDVRDACRKAQILEFIESLPEKFETTAGERGVQLSGGQRQRIGLARIFLRKPKIVILDEPSSALDVITEDKLFETLYANLSDITLIVIAHRLSTIKDVDRVLVFKDGSIVEEGSFKDLQERPDGIFSDMVKSHKFLIREREEEVY
ncbi:MAG: hypothetical protein A2X49_00855 [Lentisphaerae bacterium GWF2_52_8]|nr:MAG: hypothetical protein A2X49_00855 [Lentisphaerae bacterium GWF2_52_8]